MKALESLQGYRRLFLVTPPVIYYIEANPRYIADVMIVFDMIDSGALAGVTSPITLAECLIVPYRLGSKELEEQYLSRIVGGQNMEFVPIDEHIARRAAELRVRYSLRLPDAIQAATALHTQCDALLTNDVTFRRVAELSVILVDEWEP